MKKRKVWVSVVAAVVVIATVAAIVMIPKMKKNPVTVISVSQVSYPDFGPGGSDSFGQVTTDQVQTAFLSDTQVVKEIQVEQGQKVTKGDILYTYDTTLSDLALERKGIEIRQKEVELKRAQTELKRLNGLRPMANVPGPVAPPTESGEKQENYDISPEKAKLGTLYAGEGESMKPYYYWLSEQEEVTDELVARLLGDRDTVYVVFQMVEGDAELTPFSSQYGVKYTKVPVEPDVTEPETKPSEPETKPTEPETNPTQPETKPTEPETNPTQPETKPTEPETKPTQPETKPTEPETQPTTAPTVPETTAPVPTPRRTGALHSGASDFRYKMSFFDYTKVNMPDEVIPEFPDIDMGSGYTQEELAELRLQQKKQIRELEFNIRMGQAELKIMEKEATNGEVTADFDGIVVSVMSPEEAKSSGQPMLKVAGGGGYYVEGSVSEMELANIKIGQSVFINNWDTGMTYEGTIAEIGQYPVENQDQYYGTENVTYYPYRVFIDESADLMEGSYVNLTYQADTASASYMNLDNAFLRTEGKKTYVYVRSEDGKLEKRFVQTGPSRDGYATPIVSGLSEMDFIAFPYGKDVRDGAATVEGTMEDLLNG